jgi:flagellar FliJ protein
MRIKLAKPVFRLESTLRYRQGIEDQEMIKMARASQQVKEQEASAERLNREKKLHYENCSSRKLSLTSLLQQEAYLNQLNQRISQQAERLENARQQMETQRTRVVEASTRKKTLERLKEKDLHEMQMRLSQTEQKILDDMGINAYCHKTIL